MSIVAFKRKSVIQYGANRSGKPGPGYWLPQGPFGKDSYLLQPQNLYGPVGFSLNGGGRSIPRVKRDLKFSQQGTRFRGVYPIGHGGFGGQYFQAEPVLNSRIVQTRGDRYKYIKPSSLSTAGMLERKYMWINNGQYPNYWVQPVYPTGTMSDNASQGLYIHQKSAANDCVVDVNSAAKYVGHVVSCGPMDCHTTTARGYKMAVTQRNAPYTKMIRIPQDSSQHTLHVQRKCANPKPWQMPFPYAVNADACNQVVQLRPSFLEDPVVTRPLTV